MVHDRKLISRALAVGALCLLLVACGGRPHWLNVSPRSNDGANPGVGRAIVVLPIVHRQSPDAESTHYALAYFKRQEPLLLTKSGETVVKRGFRNYANEKVLALPPGRYYLRWLSYSAGARKIVVHRAKSSTASTGGVFEFDVSAGEVVYLGHVVTHWPKSSPGEYLLMGVESRPDAAKRILRDEFGDRADPIIARLTTRLVKVPKAIW